MNRDGPPHAAPMGLKTFIIWLVYYTHVAPTELAVAPNGNVSGGGAVAKLRNQCSLAVRSTEYWAGRLLEMMFSIQDCPLSVLQRPPSAVGASRR